MLMGRNAIIEAMGVGEIVCDPAPAKVEAVHIDLHLGEWYWQLAHKAAIDLASADPEACYELRRIRRSLAIPPGGFVLAHTAERAGTTVPWLCPFIETRSTLARWGIAVHLSAGWGDPGYCGRWTLEIYNHRPQSVAIPAGARICSIGFHRVRGNDTLYAARYNSTADDWTPEAMLPRRGNL